DRVGDGLSVDKIQRLRKAEIAAPVALAGRLARGTAEQVEKAVSAHVRIGQLLGPRLGGNIREGDANAGNKRESIHELFRTETARNGMREILDVFGVPLVRCQARLISPRVGYDTHQIAKIEAMVDEVL